MTDEKWITVAEAAAIMGVTGAGVRRMCKYHQIKSQKFGHVWMIDREAAQNYTPQKPGPKPNSN